MFSILIVIYRIQNLEIAAKATMRSQTPKEITPHLRFTQLQHVFLAGGQIYIRNLGVSSTNYGNSIILEKIKKRIKGNVRWGQKP